MITRWTYHFEIRTCSEANSTEHWTKKAKRHRLQKQKIWAILHSEKPPMSIPCTIVLTRIAPRELDSDDNLPMSFKYIKDAVAEYLVPGKAIGRADDDKAIEWHYRQKKGQVREYGVTIEMSCET